MIFNFKKALVMGFIGLFVSIPLIILYALIPGIIGIENVPNIDHSYYATIALTILFFIIGSQMRRTEQVQSSGMKESPTSLRLFFGVTGIASLIVNVLFLLVAAGTSSLTLILMTFVSSLNAILSFGYLYFAFMLVGYLNPTRVKYVNIFIFSTLGVYLLSAALNFFALGGIDVITLVISILITWYLYRNVHRLSTNTETLIP